VSGDVDDAEAPQLAVPGQIHDLLSEASGQEHGGLPAHARAARTFWRVAEAGEGVRAVSLPARALQTCPP